MANINAELSIVDSNGDVTVLYPKTYANNVFMSDGVTVEEFLNALPTSSGGSIPINPTDKSNINMWLEV